jgi:peptide chain release factor subunit 3
MYDPIQNPLLPNEQQMTFMYTHYPDYTKDFMNISPNTVRMM